MQEFHDTQFEEIRTAAEIVLSVFFVSANANKMRHMIWIRK